MRSNPKFNLSLAGILLLVVTLACGRGARNDRPVAGGNPPSSTSAAGSAVVNVVAEDFLFSLDASQAAAGAVTFVVRNEGDMPHDFAIQGPGADAKTPMLEPGESATLEVTLAAGTYEYICTIPGHAVLGMQGEFTVV
jgi:uncharacterized cupredoxin-like copper-binding protein